MTSVSQTKNTLITSKVLNSVINNDVTSVKNKSKSSDNNEKDGGLKTRKTKKQNRGFTTYIYRVLKNVHPDTSITQIASNQLNDYLVVLTREIGKLAGESSQSEDKITITSREIQHAVRTILPNELAKHAVSEGTKAVTKYNATIVEDEKDHKSASKNDVSKKSFGATKGTPKKKSETKSHKCGLTFPVARCEKHLRKFGGGKARVGAGAPVYLAAVLEYICSEILELGGNAARDEKRITIKTRHIYLAIANDQELNQLSESLKIEFRGCGVLPCINSKLLPDSDKVKANKKKRDHDRKTNGTENANHKFLPGTVALREIRQYQKTTELLTQKAPFERVFRKIAHESDIFSSNDCRFSEGVIEAVQSFIELRLTIIFAHAQNQALYAKREGVSAEDVQISSKNLLSPRITFSAFYGITYEDIEIPNPALKRLARRGGVKRITSGAYVAIKECTAVMLCNIAKGLLNETQFHKMKTVSLKILKNTLANLGYNYIV